MERYIKQKIKQLEIINKSPHNNEYWKGQIDAYNEILEHLLISDVRSSKLSESLSEESKSDLIDLKNELQFVSEFDIEIYEAIKVIDKLFKMNWKQIEEWRTHLITNYSTTKLEDFTLRLIDRYCSNVD